MALQIERSLTTAARLADIPQLGEPVWDNEELQLYVGDGVTVGGRIAAQGGVDAQQADRLSAVDWRATKSMHQTLKLMDLAHWSNNLAEIFGAENFGADDHHAREGVYCMRTRQPGQGNNSFLFYYPGSAFYLPPYSFINGRYIDWYATFDYPNPPGSVGFRVALIVDPDGTETVATGIGKFLAYVDCSGVTSNNTHQTEIHVRIHAEGMQSQSSYSMLARQYPKSAPSLPVVATDYADTSERKLTRNFDMTVGHRVAIGVLNQSGDATEVDNGYYFSTSSNYEELRMLRTSAWLHGGGRTN